MNDRLSGGELRSCCWTALDAREWPRYRVFACECPRQDEQTLLLIQLIVSTQSSEAELQHRAVRTQVKRLSGQKLTGRYRRKGMDEIQQRVAE